MSDTNPTTTSAAPGAAGPTGATTGTTSSAGAPTSSAPAPSSTKQKDPLRGSRASGAWVFISVLVVLLALLAIFVLQNTQSVEVSFLGWSGNAPLATSLLIATAAGMAITVLAGSLRILQLRRRVKREEKRNRR